MLTSVTPTERSRDARPAYRPFRARVAATRVLTPSFTRVTFTGDDFEHFGTAKLDQRVKIMFPLPGIGISDCGIDDPEVHADGTWYTRWRELPDDQRNPFRTYTVRDVRPEAREVDIDFVVHGADDDATQHGPASQWLHEAALGDELVIVGPDDRSVDWRSGLDWHPGSARQVLLLGDETAAPAICGILESLGPDVSATAFLEIPTDRDRLEVDLPSGASLTWLPRASAAASPTPHGEQLKDAARAWVAANAALVESAQAPRPQELEAVDVDNDLVWDSPFLLTGEEPSATDPGHDFYAWIAGETAAIVDIRRFLVKESGVDRSRVAFMGYWRAGRAERQ